MYHETLNQALESENIEMTMDEVSEKIGTMAIGQSVRFQKSNRQVCLYRMDSGRYEVFSYGL